MKKIVEHITEKYCKKCKNYTIWQETNKKGIIKCNGCYTESIEWKMEDNKSVKLYPMDETITIQQHNRIITEITKKLKDRIKELEEQVAANPD